MLRVWKCTNTFRTVLANELEKLRQEKGVDTLTELTKNMHLYPDLHGKLNEPIYNLSSHHPFILKTKNITHTHKKKRQPLPHRRPDHDRLHLRAHARQLPLRPRAEIPPHARSHRPPNAAHRRHDERRRPRGASAVHVGRAGAERQAHAALCGCDGDAGCVAPVDERCGVEGIGDAGEVCGGGAEWGGGGGEGVMGDYGEDTLPFFFLSFLCASLLDGTVFS